MIVIRTTFTAITAAQARRHQTASHQDDLCSTHCVTVAQHRKARETLWSDEQAGNMIMFADPSANATMLPDRFVPNNAPTRLASNSRKILEKKANSSGLHNIGTVSARKMRAARRRLESRLANSRM